MPVPNYWTLTKNTPILIKSSYDNCSQWNARVTKLWWYVQIFDINWVTWEKFVANVLTETSWERRNVMRHNVTDRDVRDVSIYFLLRMPGVANFAHTIKIAIIFNKTTFGDSKGLYIIIKMQFWSVFPSITEIANFRWKICDINRTQAVRHMWEVLGRRYFARLLPFVSRPEKAHPE